MRATINRWDRNDRTIDRSRINDALVRRRRVINVASLLPSHLSQAWPTAPTHSTHSPPHLTSLTSQHELDPTQRKAEATDFPVFFFFFRLELSPIDHVRDELTRLLATIKRSFTLQEGSSCYRLVQRPCLRARGELSATTAPLSLDLRTIVG